MSIKPGIRIALFDIEPDEEDLKKANFGRGSTRAHKYIRRVRVMSNGKLTWKYYYPDDKTKKRERAKLKKQKKKNPKAKLADEAIHATMAEFHIDNPVSIGRKPLSDVSPEYLEKLSFAEFDISEATIKKHHTPAVKAENPGSLLGQHLSPLRAAELAYQRFPQDIVEALDLDAVRIVNASSDHPAWKGGKATAYADPIGHDIVAAWDKVRQFQQKAPRYMSGTGSVDVMVHELAHHLEFFLGNTRDLSAPEPKNEWDKKHRNKKWKAWVKFLKGLDEPAITSYAKKDESERFAESVACALNYPKQMAATCPKTYDWLRDNVFGDHLRPRKTDMELKLKLEAAIEKEKKRKRKGKKIRAAKIREYQNKIDQITGLEDMADDDDRLTWWEAQPTRVQKLLRQAEKPNYAAKSVSDTFHGDDKFYEMNWGGRTLYMRIGPRWDSKSQSWDRANWAPKVGDDYNRLKTGHIKEIYAEDGTPLGNKEAWWWLAQDTIGERDEIPGEELFGRDSDLDVSKLVSFREWVNKENNDIKNALRFMDVLHRIGRTDEKMEARPVEISKAEYRQRSGTFAYDNWEEPGAHLLDDLEAAQPGTKKHKKLLDEYRKFQPWVAFETVTATQWHVDQGLANNTGQVMGRRYLTDNGIPRVTLKKFVNDNPDGSKSIIECELQEDGRYYIRNPMWRELLTPNGGAVRSAEHLRQLCRDATEAKIGEPSRPRRTWVSIRTDVKGKTDSEHYMHVQVEFDGRGQPRVLGEEWKHLLHKDDPRIDDLLEPAKENETRRPKLPGEKIKMVKQKRRRGKELIPKVGERAVLEVSTSELGLVTEGPDRRVVVRLGDIIPAKKAGEKPSPPGWERMPDPYDKKPLPTNEIGDASANRELTEYEKELIDEGRLPDWYSANEKQRLWLEEVFKPAVQHWEDTLEEETAKEYPERYVFYGESAGGAGQKKFIRYGERSVEDTIAYPKVSPKPKPLKHTPLMYLHRETDPVTGEVYSVELRMVLPQDGHISAKELHNSVPGIEVIRAESDIKGVEGAVQYLKSDISTFADLRETIGGVSLTRDAEIMLQHYKEHMEEAAEKAQEEAHVVPLEELDPSVLNAMGVGLVTHLPNGSQFKLAHHQMQLVQKLIDNNGRVLGAHFMGTGKTVSAIAAAKFMMARRNPEHPYHDPDAPKKTLVVAPLNTVEQWREAAYDFDEGATVVGARSSDIPADKYLEMVKEGADTNDLVIVGPEYFTINEKELSKAGFDALVVDEAHKGIKNAKTERNKAISKWNEDMKMMMLLTGTPITTSPSDILEYIKILSKSKQWAGFSRKKLEDMYLEESPVLGEAGVKGRRGPKVQIKPSKRAELAGILARWVHVAMGKDVRGKTLPAVRIEENKHANMEGIQADLYALQLATLPDAAKDKLAENEALAKDELANLDKEDRRRAINAKKIANCPAYKPASDEEFLQTRVVSVDEDFKTFGIEWLMKRKDIRNKRLRKKLKGRWPPVSELHPMQVAIYNAYFKHVLDPENKGLTYEMIAGSKVTKAQIEAMESEHEINGIKYEPWGDTGVKVQNPEFGPLGVKFRGVSEERPLTKAEMAQIQKAQEFRRRYAAVLTTPEEGKRSTPVRSKAWEQVKDEFGIDEEEAQRLMGTPPKMYKHQDTLTRNGVTVTSKDRWVSDQRGSRHLLYRYEDWNFDEDRPKSAGGFESVEHMADVELTKLPSWMEKPENVDEDEWLGPPRIRYREDQGSKPGGRVAVEVLDGEFKGQIKWVRKSRMQAKTPSLMDPGRRKERAKADIAMVAGNAKAEELATYVQNFHIHTGNGNFIAGEDRSRAMVIFANGILDGCRTVEATLRTQGFKDVNEAIKGSRQYDPEDGGPAPNGKYFVTYIGSTYTGDRELNIAISKKKKDKLDRDTDVSLFVHKTMEGRTWRLWPGGPKHPHIKRSQWTKEQRDRIWDQFEIKAPEAHFVSDDGEVKYYFYGSDDKVKVDGQTIKGSAALLREMVLTGDPNKMVGAKKKKAQERLKKLQTAYEGLVRKHAVTDKPMTEQQANIMNNCEILVASDAAQVGLNKGDAVEMVMYDSLASPMAEMQRITRSARMLPPAVRDELLNKYISEVKGIKGSKFGYAQLSDSPDHPAYEPGAKRKDLLWEAIQKQNKRPENMTFVDYKRRAKANGADPVSEDQFNSMGILSEFEERDYDRVLWVKDGKVAVKYKDSDGEKQTTWVKPSKIKEADGPFRKIRENMEAEAFDPSWAGLPPPGQVLGARPLGAKNAEDMSFDEVLEQIGTLAAEQAEDSKSKVQKEEWNAIAARARTASTLGVVAAASAIREFSGMKVPGGTKNLIEHKGLEYQEPTEGTYAIRTAAERARGVKGTPMEQAIEAPINAIRTVLDNELTDEDRERIADAGYVTQDEAGSMDATEIYLSIRAQQIMDDIARKRPEVERRMRATAAGQVVTEADVMNTIIDELSPMDRAVLKSKKYLVNVRRIGVSGNLPQQVKAKEIVRNDAGVPIMDRGKPKKQTTRVFAGYEQEHPVSVERATRAIGRSRRIPVENLLHTIQQGVKVRVKSDFVTTDSKEIANASRLDPITKSLVFPAWIFGQEA